MISASIDDKQQISIIVRVSHPPDIRSERMRKDLYKYNIAGC